MIQALGLMRHPEGGYYRETYRSAEWLSVQGLPKRYRDRRVISTAIYYLLRRGDFSALHRIQSDEIWHFHSGAPLEIVMISKRGVFSSVRLGLNFKKGERPQILIPRGVWFGAAVAGAAKTNYTLTSCTVAPGFDFRDFEMARRSELLKKFPRHRLMILKWTRGATEAKVAE